jgi:hypothetical protein
MVAYPRIAARLGRARQGLARGPTDQWWRIRELRRGKAGQGGAWQGLARRGEGANGTGGVSANCGQARQGRARLGKAGRGNLRFKGG